MDKIELLGGACFSHGPYTFYKAVRIGNGRVLRLGSFFLTKLWSDADLVSIGELQLLWTDSRGPNTPLASLRLYFLPENTPDGRRDTHGEDEVLTISEKVVVRVNDLLTWLSPDLAWTWGREISYPLTPSTSPEGSPLPQVLTDPGIDFSEVDKHQEELDNGSSRKHCDDIPRNAKVVVLSYPRYCRYRALLRRIEQSEPAWLSSAAAAALGGFSAVPGTRVLFCRDTFDYPDLETHELLCNHLAPKLKGRPRRKRKKRSVSPGESSNESEASVASTSKGSSTNSNQSAGGKTPASGVRRSERKTSAEEKRFVNDVQNFMSTRGTPVGKMPWLGYRQIDLFLFYTKVQNLGGYDAVSTNRQWKIIYDDIGGNTNSTSAATITRRHYERLLLPYERYQRGEETKVRPSQGSRRTKTISITEDVIEIKQEVEVKNERESPSPLETPASPSGTSNSAAVSPPLQTIPSPTPFQPIDKTKPEAGKTSLRSVRVKPERLKSLNTMIANDATPASQPTSQLPSPPPVLSTSGSSSPTSTPSTTPTIVIQEPQINSPPLISQRVSPPLPCSSPEPTGTPVPAVVTLTPPPEKDMKEMKLDPKQTNLLAQGKENIPLFDEKPIFVDKPIVQPRSPEVIDLESDGDASRDKLIIPNFKKRKLEILREGGLEVTAVELDTRPSVIQPNATPTPTPPSPTTANVKIDENPSFSPVTSTSIPKLINVTVTPDIGHMFPSENRAGRQQVPMKLPTSQSNTNATNNVVNSRIINLGTSNNATLLQLYANANVPMPKATNRFASTPTSSDRSVPMQKVTQSRSIFAHNEKVVYGNPKDILIPSRYPPPVVQPQIVRHEPGGVLDLTQKAGARTAFARPNLEIVKVPVVPRPSPLNLETRNAHKDKPSESLKKSQFNSYQNMLDSRTMATNNLEITLVGPKKSHSVGQQLQSTSPPVRVNGVIPRRQQPSPHQQPQMNGKFTSESYAPRKPIHTVIPNVPNLSHLNNTAAFAKSSNPEKRRVVDKEHQRRISESEKSMAGQSRLEPPKQPDVMRRHSVPNIPSGFIPSVPQSNAYLPQLPNSGKFLPFVDPMYYTALCNGLFPPPMGSPVTQPILPPELSAYYKEQLASLTRLSMAAGQHQPAAPTSK